MSDPALGSSIVDRLTTLIAAHRDGLGPLLIGGSALVEYVFPPYPGEMIVLFGAFLVARQGWSTPVWVAVVLAGSFLGICALYVAGRLLRAHEPRFSGRLGRLQAQIDALVLRFAPRATRWLVANRFVPSVRWMIIVAAGMAGVPAGRAIGAAFASAVLWNAFLLLIGHLVGSRWDELMALLDRFGKLGAVLVVVGIVAVLGVLSLRARRRANDP